MKKHQVPTRPFSFWYSKRFLEFIRAHQTQAWIDWAILNKVKMEISLLALNQREVNHAI
jgi:hypothetical protein